MDWVEIDPTDTAIINELRETAFSEIRLQQNKPDPFRKTAPRDPDQFQGELNLGIIPHHGHAYNATIESINKNWLLLGKIGGGKTTLMRNALFKTLRQPDPPKVTIIERKQEYTELLVAFPNMHVLDSKNLAFNPLRPPKGFKPSTWISIFTEVLINHLDVREASASFIMEHALRLISNMGKEGGYPTLKDLRTYIQQQPYKPFSKNGQQKETVLNRLNDLLNSLPAMFESDKQTDIEQLINSHCLILLHDITHGNIQNFVVSLLIAQLFLYRKIHCGLQPSLTNILVIDEASALFRRSDEIKDHVSFANDVIKTARGYGIGFIAASQMATDLSHALLANAGTRIMVGGFGRTEDIDLFLRLRGCSKEQRQYVLNHPNVGKAFIVDDRWPHIIECDLHNPEIPMRPSKEELERRIQESAGVLMVKDTPSAHMEQVKAEAQTAKNEVPVSIETQVLLHIYENHFLRLTDRAKALKIPSTTLKRAISYLESSGQIIVHKVHGRSGAPRDLYEVTPTGLDAIQQPEKEFEGKGGYLHKFYQQCVSSHYRTEKYRTKIEGVADGKNIDVIARKSGGECIAVEIELHSNSNPDHVLENLERAAQASCVTSILCLVPTEAERRKIEKLTTTSLFMNKPLSVERLWKYVEQ